MSSPDYYRLALQQQMLYNLQIEKILAVQQEIEVLKSKIVARHKKHRRCDKEIQKVHQCQFCEKKYASDIALKLHFKLKHRKTVEDRTGGCSTEEQNALIDQSEPQELSQSLLPA